MATVRKRKKTGVCTPTPTPGTAAISNAGWTSVLPRRTPRQLDAMSDAEAYRLAVPDQISVWGAVPRPAFIINLSAKRSNSIAVFDYIPMYSALLFIVASVIRIARCSFCQIRKMFPLSDTKPLFAVFPANFDRELLTHTLLIHLFPFLQTDCLLLQILSFSSCSENYQPFSSGGSFKILPLTFSMRSFTSILAFRSSYSQILIAKITGLTFLNIDLLLKCFQTHGISLLSCEHLLSIIVAFLLIIKPPFFYHIWFSTDFYVSTISISKSIVLWCFQLTLLLL